MAAIIHFPSMAMATVIRSLEHALELARGGHLSGLVIAYLDEEHGIYQCLEAQDALSAVTLLGQSSLMIEDMRELTRDFRKSEQERL